MKVIKSIHDIYGGVGSLGRKPKRGRVWSTIVKVFDNLHYKHVIPPPFLHKRIRNDGNTRFIEEVW